MTNKTNTLYETGTKINFKDLQAQEDAQISRMVYNGITRARMLLKLEARMIAYDTLHRTHYRKLRHAAVARERNAKFEQSIGLIRTK